MSVNILREKMTGERLTDLPGASLNDEWMSRNPRLRAGIVITSGPAVGISRDG